MRSLMFLMVCSLTLASAFAAPPTAKIKGPDAEVEPGDLVELDASESVGEAIAWKSLDLPDSRYRLYEQGKKLTFAAKQGGRLRFLLIVAGRDGDSVAIVTAEHSVVVAGVVPQPSPGPLPSTEDKWGLFKSVREKAELVSSHRDVAAKFAANYRTVAKLGLAGKMNVTDASGKTDFVGTSQAIAVALGASNATLPSTARPAWLPVVVHMNERLTELSAPGGKISTVEDLCRAMNDIAAALETIK